MLLCAPKIWGSTNNCWFPFFFFNDTATTEIYTLSLHDALPISISFNLLDPQGSPTARLYVPTPEDRKSTRLNSSHQKISYAVFCLKKKKIYTPTHSMSHHHTTSYIFFYWIQLS